MLGHAKKKPVVQGSWQIGGMITVLVRPASVALQTRWSETLRSSGRLQGLVLGWRLSWLGLNRFSQSCLTSSLEYKEKRHTKNVRMIAVSFYHTWTFAGIVMCQTSAVVFCGQRLISNKQNHGATNNPATSWPALQMKMQDTSFLGNHYRLL